jgi:hypothetical protein
MTTVEIAERHFNQQGKTLTENKSLDNLKLKVCSKAAET